MTVKKNRSPKEDFDKALISKATVYKELTHSHGVLSSATTISFAFLSLEQEKINNKDKVKKNAFFIKLTRLYR